MKRFIIIICALLAVAATGLIIFKKHKTTRQTTYQKAHAQKGDLQIFVSTTGSVKPQNRIEIKSPVAGRVEDSLAVEGLHVRKGQILAWMSSTERATLLDAARAKGETELAYWEELYRPTPLVAPLDGDIIARNIEPGQTITASDILFVMSDRLIIEAQVDETDLGRLIVGQKAEITLDAYPETIITGKIDHIAFEAKTVNNVTTYKVDVLPDAAPQFLRSGLTANIRILVANADSVLILPTAALHHENNQTFVLRPGNDKTHFMAPVQTGLSDLKNTEIISGLTAGDTVLMTADPIFAGQDENNKHPPFMPGKPRSKK